MHNCHYASLVLSQCIVYCSLQCLQQLLKDVVVGLPLSTCFVSDVSQPEKNTGEMFSKPCPLILNFELEPNPLVAHFWYHWRFQQNARCVIQLR